MKSLSLKNQPAKKVHEKFDDILKLMNLTGGSLRYLKESFKSRFDEELKNRNVKLKEVSKPIERVQKQIETIEENLFQTL